MMMATREQKHLTKEKYRLAEQLELHNLDSLDFFIGFSCTIFVISTWSELFENLVEMFHGSCVHLSTELISVSSIALKPRSNIQFQIGDLEHPPPPFDYKNVDSP